MSADTDIVERLDQAASNFDAAYFCGTVLREAAAEIVRLRGELDVANTAIGECAAREALHYQAIAPAEAKGDAVAWRRPTPYGVGYSFASEEVMRDLVGYVAESFDTPQPADGGAVACTVVGYLPFERAVEVRLSCEIPEWITNRRTDDAWLSSHKPAARPSACELGADTARLDWLEANCVDVADEYGTGSQLYLGTYATAPLRTAIDRAIQHRGDSRGGEGSGGAA